MRRWSSVVAFYPHLMEPNCCSKRSEAKHLKNIPFSVEHSSKSGARVCVCWCVARIRISMVWSKNEIGWDVDKTKKNCVDKHKHAHTHQAFGTIMCRNAVTKTKNNKLMTLEYNMPFEWRSLRSKKTSDHGSIDTCKVVVGRLLRKWMNISKEAVMKRVQSCEHINYHGK